MQAPLRFSIADPGGNVVVTGEGSGTITSESLTIAPKQGEPRSFSLRDIISILDSEYRIRVALAGGDVLILSNLGYKFEDFARNLVQARNEQSLKDLLMEERIRKQGVKADFALLDRNGHDKVRGRCEVRLYETAIVVMPERTDLIRVPYSDLSRCSIDSFKATALLESGEMLEFGRLGNELEPFRREVVSAMTELEVRVQNMLRDVHPTADLNAILKASQFMKEGRAARRSDLESACPGLWSLLEKRIAGLGLAEEYAFLSAKSTPERIRIGMKRTLVGEKQEDYIWFLAPIYSDELSKGGNAIAFEATSSDDEGRATYFLRMMGRKEYAGTKDVLKLNAIAEAALTETAIGLLAINFRREPIYIPDERLNAPEYAQYRYSIMRIPELRLIRERFIGRVIHSSIEQWKLDVDDLLRFNTTQESDALIWKKPDGGSGH